MLAWFVVAFMAVGSPIAWAVCSNPSKPIHRKVLGSTLYLPSCGMPWTISKAPAEPPTLRGEVMQRLTPSLPGAYELTSKDGAEDLRVEWHAEIPYEEYDYFPHGGLLVAKSWI